MLVLAKERISKDRPDFFKRAVFTAEGDTWLNRCDDIVNRIFQWILVNTDETDELHIIVEEPVNMVMQRAWSAAIQNRLFGLLLPKLLLLNQHMRPTTIYSIFPTSVKKIFTGSGKAKKEQMIKKAGMYIKFRKDYPKAIKECIADSVAIAYCGWKVCSPGTPLLNGITLLSGARVED